MQLHQTARPRRNCPTGICGLLSAALVLMISGANCFDLWQPPEDNTQRTPGLRAFGSPEELRQFFIEQANDRYTDSRTYGGGWFFGLFPTPAAAPQNDMSDKGNTGGEGSEGEAPYSTTTIQELGVDESDIVKNDGQYIYWLRSPKIHIVKATPPDAMTQVATITLEKGADQIYLRGTQLIALSRGWSYGYMEGGPGIATVAQADIAPMPWQEDSSKTTVTVFNVSDPANPVKQTTLKFDGTLAESRVIANRLYLVTTTWPEPPDGPIPLQDVPLDDWLPKYTVTGSDGQSREGITTPWDGFYRPIVGDGYQITTVVTIDLDDPGASFKATAITANAGTIYASLNALYVTDTNYDWTLDGSRQDTMVHKLAFTEAGTDYIASGLVPGRPLNQYSLGEYEGYLRIATTNESWAPAGGGLTNGVYVLGVDSTDLKVVGKVEDLGIGEQIYAVRFIGPRGFVVTFKRIDPLFAMDLSDPTNPRVVGQLKIPGYSDFMVPMGADHLLAIGKDAQDAGDWGAWVQGVQLSIFDVSDMSNPKRIHNEIIGSRGTNSEANYNPKAFNYFPAKGALAFPIELYSGDTTGPEWGSLDFVGLMVYSVSTTSGFAELGRISTVPDSQSPSGCGWMYYGASRGIFIGDYVYAVSDLGVKSAGIQSASTVVDEVPFTDNAPEENCGWVEPDILPEFGVDLR